MHQILPATRINPGNEASSRLPAEWTRTSESSVTKVPEVVPLPAAPTSESRRPPTPESPRPNTREPAAPNPESPRPQHPRARTSYSTAGQQAQGAFLFEVQGAADRGRDAAQAPAEIGHGGPHRRLSQYPQTERQ